MRASRGQEPIDISSYMKDELKGKYVPQFYSLIFLTNGVELPKATNMPRSMLSNSTSFSLTIISWADRVTSKSFLNFVLNFE